MTGEGSSMRWRADRSLPASSVASRFMVLDQSVRSLTTAADAGLEAAPAGADAAGDDAAVVAACVVGLADGVFAFEVVVLVVVVAATAVDVTSKTSVPVIAVGAKNAAIRITMARQ